MMHSDEELELIRQGFEEGEATNRLEGLYPSEHYYWVKERVLSCQITFDQGRKEIIEAYDQHAQLEQLRLVEKIKQGWMEAATKLRPGSLMPFDPYYELKLRLLCRDITLEQAEAELRSHYYQPNEANNTNPATN